MPCCLQGAYARISYQKIVLQLKRLSQEQLKQGQGQNSQTLSLYLPAKIDN